MISWVCGKGFCPWTSVFISPRIRRLRTCARAPRVEYINSCACTLVTLESRRHRSEIDGECRHTASIGGSVILPPYQVCDDEDELAHIERLRQVSLVAGYKGPLPIFRPGKRRES